jgi:hypothetical protein
MFRNTIPDTEPAPVVAPPADLIPLSHLSLDVDEPCVGWDAYLSGRGLEVVLDDVGRPSIPRVDARMLFAEKQEGEARKREIMERNEQRMVEADQAWRAGLHKGVEWWRLPDGMTPGDAMALAAAEASHQKSVQESLLEQEFGGPQNSMVYQSFSNDAAES